MSDDAVIAAVKDGNVDRLRELLKERPRAAAARDDEGTSALLHARYRDREDLVKMLLDAGAPVDAFEAAALGDSTAHARAIERDASIVSSWSHDGFTLLHLAAFFGHEDAVDLLLAHDADVTSVSHSPMHVTPLHSAVAGDHRGVARKLVAHGADVNARQSGGWTPLHSAAANGDEELVLFLLESGAYADSAQDEGRTAADLAEERGHPELASLLRERT
jgi:ankyrin repeat protein